MTVHLSGGPRLGHTWCDLPSPREVTADYWRATCATCLQEAEETVLAARPEDYGL